MGWVLGWESHIVPVTLSVTNKCWKGFYHLTLYYRNLY